MPEQPPSFFVPHAEGDDEKVYATLAEFAGRQAMPLDERIYSIRYRHNGEDWTATVGERLTGVRVKVTKGRERVTHLGDDAIVLAIFAAAPYLVVTNAFSSVGIRSAWVNPFMAGVPSNVVRFRPAPAGAT